MADTWVCPNCGTEWDEVSEFCPNCGWPSDPANRTMPIGSVTTADPRETVPPIVLLFGIVGVGLAASLLIVLWSGGYFGAAHLIPRFFRPIIATATLGFGFVFAMLIGGVVAAFGAKYIADRSATRADAVAGSAIAAGLGHLLMVAVIVLTLVATVYATVTGSDSASPFGGSSRTAIVTPNPSVAAECVRTFGAEAQICKGTPTFPSVGELKDPDVPGVGLTAKNIGKTALGAIPSAIVGALAAALFFDRPRRRATDL